MGHRDVCADCGTRLPADDFSRVRCDECQIAAGIKLWETQVLRVLITDAELGQLDETQAWAAGTPEVIPGVTTANGRLLVDEATGLPAFGFSRARAQMRPRRG